VPPPKKVPETDAIFAGLKELHAAAAHDPTTLRASLDAKAAVNLGPFSRGGESRTGTTASDHDFKPSGRLTPTGIFLPEHDELDLYFTHSKVTSDFLADLVEDWWTRHRERFAVVKQLILDLDNGPENHSRRSQFLHRMVQFAQTWGVTVILAYYPPYHSKYNPIERCWGVLENYWRGELLDSEAAVLGYASRMTYNGKHPRVTRVTKEYVKGVCRTKAEMKALEEQVQRKAGLEKWFVVIPPARPDQTIP
jgi:Rhodopirellula transposase DDE domain